MKKILFCALLTLVIALLCGCNCFEIQGLDNFNEKDCCYGLNDDLLPEDRDFLANYQYENGDYQYWRNNYGPAKAKTYVYLQYSKEIYLQAKNACEEYFTLSTEQYAYEDYVFYGVNLANGSTELEASIGFRMFGYSDKTYSLIFIGYLSLDEKTTVISSSDFPLFFEEHYG